MRPSFKLSFPKDIPPQRCTVDSVSGTVTVDVSNCPERNPLRNPLAPEEKCTELCERCKSANRTKIEKGMCSMEIANIVSDKLMAVVRKQFDAVSLRDEVIKIMP